jgi:hypothetical protein
VSVRASTTSTARGAAACCTWDRRPLSRCLPAINHPFVLLDGQTGDGFGASSVAGLASS